MTDYCYCVTAQPPTAISHSLTGNFTGEDDLNLIVGKHTRFEVHLVGPEGLQLLAEIPINGRIATMKLIRPRGAKKDRLFISVERYQYCVLEYDECTKQVVTKTTGKLEDRSGRPTQNGQIGIVDPDCTVVGLHLYDGVLKVIECNNQGHLKPEPFSARIEELHVISMCFLDGYEVPTILVLHQDSKEARHLKTYQINSESQRLDIGPWQQPNVENKAHMLIPLPVPLGGALIVGEHSIVYYNGVLLKMEQMKSARITCYGKVDINGARWLLGDSTGNLLVCVLHHEADKITNVHIETIGIINIPSTISYLDNGVVFIGSCQGDSQLIRLNSEKDVDGSYIDILETFKNLGPIVDLCVVDLDRQGQGQVVTCSGVATNGSLRIIRNGIGINEHAQIEMPGIKGLWSLRDTFKTDYDKYLVESFIGDTRILSVTEEGLEEIEIPGFQESQTMYCTNVMGDQLLQVTDNCVRLVSCANLQLNAKWEPDQNVRINVASANPTQVLLATSGGNLVLLNVNGSELVEVVHKKLDKEVSCLDITSISGDFMSTETAVVGMWEDNSLRILSVPSLEEIRRESLGDIIPRSVMFVLFQDAPYLLCGLGDGNLINWEISGASELSHKKKISLGTQPIMLSTFKSKDETHVFAASDRPTVIYRSNEKLLYSNVNLEQVNYMAPFNAEMFPSCLAFGLEESLHIGTIDEIQKLHIRDVPLGEHPRRIAHSPPTHSYCISTVRPNPQQLFDAPETNCVKLLDEQTFEPLDSFDLLEYEVGSSLKTIQFEGSDTLYYVVGTAFAKPEENEPTKGRILVIKVIEKKMQVIVAHEVNGAVYSMETFRGKLLAGINSKVHLYEWQSEGDEKHLASITSHHGHVIALYLKSRGDFLIVGDLMRSISLLVYRPMTRTIEELSRDYEANWMTSVEMFNDEVFIGAENGYNLFTVKKNTNAVTDEERARLNVCGRYHLGEFINVFQHGSLVMFMPDPDVNMDGKEDEKEEDFHFSSALKQKMIFGTRNGAVGVIASLNKKQYEFLHQVQEELEKLKTTGGFSHKKYRTFYNHDSGTKDSMNFIDGDLIEHFLTLPHEEMSQIAEKCHVSIDYLVKQIDDIARIK